MSLANSIYTAFSAPVTEQFHGDSLSRLPLGDSGSPEAVAGVVFVEKDADAINEKGKKVKRMATLLVPEAITCDVRDTWLIDADEWKVSKVHDAGSGTRSVEIIRVEVETRRNGK